MIYIQIGNAIIFNIIEANFVLPQAQVFSFQYVCICMKSQRCETL